MSKIAPFLFHTASDTPLSTLHPAFYLDSRVADSIAASISEFGGLVTPILTETSIHLLSFPPKHYVPEIIHHSVYSYLFVVDSVRLLELQLLQHYRLTTQPPVQKQIQGRNAYTYEEERRIYDYVKDHSKEGLRSLSYWIKARSMLGDTHPPESLRYHYHNFTSKMDFSGGRKKWQAHLPVSPQGLQDSEEDELVKVTVWPPKRVKLPSSLKRENPAKGPSPPRKSLKSETPPQSPIASIKPLEESPQASLVASLSQLSLSSALAEASYGEADTLATFQRLVKVCQATAKSQVLEREVLRALVHFNGDVQATVLYYSPSEA